jgi:hypothetical protein
MQCHFRLRAIFLWLLVLLSLFVLLRGLFSIVSTSLANRVFPALERPDDQEAPLTIMQFPPSSEILALLGGRGEGLNCSINPILEQIFFPAQKNSAPISLQFRQACVYHDMCYRHGAATYGYSQKDCDYSLQEQSYRLCRQFEDENKRSNTNAMEKHSLCETKAKKILLAVLLGGGASFQSDGDSTYHEFDSIPTRADDFIVGRALRLSDVQDGRHLQALTLHIRRHSLVRRMLDWNRDMYKEGKKEADYIFPRTSVATPPIVVNDKGNDRLLAIARNGISNTGGKIIDLSDNLGISSSIDQGDYSINFIESSNEEKARVTRISHRSPQICQKGGTNSVGFISYPLTEQEPKACATEERQWGKWPDTADHSVARDHDLYRFLQSPPLIGRFTSKSNEILVFNRGLDEVGHDYQEKVRSVLFRRKPGSSSDSSRILPISETQEPVVSIPNGEGKDLLFTAQSGILSGVTAPSFSVLDLGSRTSNTQESLDNSWLRQQIQFVRKGSKSDASYVFFSRVCFVLDKQEEGNCVWPERDKLDSMISQISAVRMEFRYFDLRHDHGYSLDLVGKASVSIPLERNDQKKADRIARWRSSQIIPGHFYANDGPLDVVVIPKGYPGWSYLFRANHTDGPLYGLDQIWPLAIIKNKRVLN